MKTVIRPVMFTLLMVLCASVRAADVEVPKEFKGSTPLQWSVKMADAQIARKGAGLSYTEGGRKKWDYADNVFLLGIIRLGQQTHDPKYAQLADKVIGSFIKEDGQIQTYKLDDYTLDSINPGKTVMALWRLNHDDDGYMHALELLRSQLETHPRTSDGGFWHKKIYPYQMWLDGLYMAGPFSAEYAQQFDRPADFDHVAKQFKLIAEHSYDPKTGLYYHGWDEKKEQPWANKTTGNSANFWSRAIGWYGMALVDTLDYFPADHPARPMLIEELKKFAAGITRWQDSSGLWWQVTDQGNREGNYLEATGSCMFVYTLAKAINKGYLPRDNATAVVKGDTAILDKLIKMDNGAPTLTQCCSVAGLGPGNTRNGSFEYYIHEPIVENDMKGVGPFIMAGIEIQQLASREQHGQ